MIFCVEDDDNIRELVIYTLETTGLEARGFADGTAFMEALAFDTPELVLLDIMLPGEDGLEILKKLKNSSKTKDIPVIMVTAKGSEYDKVVGLDSGADDYVTKPYRVKELLARVAVNIRRYTQAQQTSQENSNRVVTFGNTIFDGEAFVLTQHGEKLDCTTSELRLLRFLLQHRGQVISRSAIMEQLYDIDGEFFEDNTLSVYIKRLRQKLGEDGAYIETVRTGSGSDSDAQITWAIGSEAIVKI